MAGEQSEYANTKCSVKGPSIARKTAALGSTVSILQTRSFNKRKRTHDNIRSGTLKLREIQKSLNIQGFRTTGEKKKS